MLTNKLHDQYPFPKLFAFCLWVAAVDGHGANEGFLSRSSSLIFSSCGLSALWFLTLCATLHPADVADSESSSAFPGKDSEKFGDYVKCPM